MKKVSGLKRVLVIFLVAGLLVGSVLGARLLVNRRHTVPVGQVLQFANTWMMDENTGYGQITKGGIQEIRLDPTLLVEEVYVEEGEEVVAGQALLKYDNTLLRLASERARIRYAIAQNALKEAQADLAYHRTFTPYQEPVPKVVTTVEELNKKTLTAEGAVVSGQGTEKDPYVINVSQETLVKDEFIKSLLTKTSPEDLTLSETGVLGGGIKKILSPGYVVLLRVWNTYPEMDSICVGEILINGIFAKEVENPNYKPEEETKPTNETKPSDNPANPEGETEEKPEEKPVEPKTIIDFDGMEKWNALRHPKSFHVLEYVSVHSDTGDVQVLDKDKISAPNKLFIETKKQRDNAIPEPIEIPVEKSYSQEEIQQMILDCTIAVRNAEIGVRRAELAYREAQLSVVDGTVKSINDGVVTHVGNVTDENGEEAFMTIRSGTSNYEVTGTINELQLGDVNIGDEFEMTVWSNGMTYTGRIKSISEYPTESMGYSDQGNLSSYAFIAELQCEDELQAWDGGEIRFLQDAPVVNDTIVLQSCFIREEDGTAFVLKAGDDDRVYRQPVEVGRVLYNGYFTEVLSGLTYEDYIAFPYGKAAVEGAKADYETGVEGW